MPKDDFDKARRRDRGRRERALLDREAEQKRWDGIKAKQKRLKNFPKHVLKLKPDGTYMSDTYTFDMKRWSHLSTE